MPGRQQQPVIAAAVGQGLAEVDGARLVDAATEQFAAPRPGREFEQRSVRRNGRMAVRCDVVVGRQCVATYDQAMKTILSMMAVIFMGVGGGGRMDPRRNARAVPAAVANARGHPRGGGGATTGRWRS
jgi:hypothetical protein